MAYWFEVHNVDELLTPTLLFYPERIAQNIDLMIRIAGSADRLRTHVKTHKCAEIVRMQIDRGISKYKCATLAEADMLGACGAADVLVAYPQVGPALQKFVELMATYPNTRFSMLIDHARPTELTSLGESLDLFIDLDVGMKRTGCVPENAPGIMQSIQELGHRFRGWHAYDGHIHDKDKSQRANAVAQSVAPVLELIDQTQTQSYELICGGSISFPIHAQDPDRQLSPGTTLLWDHGYGHQYTDLPFLIGATVLTRVISKPGIGQLCFDLGHKALSAEMQAAPAHFPQIPDAKFETHSEEHLVISTKDAQAWEIGDLAYAFPYHICPTVALHHQVAVIQSARVSTFWPIVARNRMYTMWPTSKRSND